MSEHEVPATGAMKTYMTLYELRAAPFALAFTSLLGALMAIVGSAIYLDTAPVTTPLMLAWAAVLAVGLAPTLHMGRRARAGTNHRQGTLRLGHDGLSETRPGCAPDFTPWHAVDEVTPLPRRNAVSVRVGTTRREFNVASPKNAGRLSQQLEAAIERDRRRVRVPPEKVPDIIRGGEVSSRSPHVPPKLLVRVAEDAAYPAAQRVAAARLAEFAGVEGSLATLMATSADDTVRELLQEET